MSDDLLDRGMKVRREVLGDEYVDRAMASRTSATEEFQDLLTRYAWGEIWTRHGLDRKTRSCITVALLVALGQEQELAAHLRGALNNGLTKRPDPRGVATNRSLLRHTARQLGLSRRVGGLTLAHNRDRGRLDPIRLGQK